MSLPSMAGKAVDVFADVNRAKVVMAGQDQVCVLCSVFSSRLLLTMLEPHILPLEVLFGLLSDSFNACWLSSSVVPVHFCTPFHQNNDTLVFHRWRLSNPRTTTSHTPPRPKTRKIVMTDVRYVAGHDGL